MSLKSLLQGVIDMAVPELSITALATDSREVRPGGLFFALAGYDGRHGLAYLQQALDQGAVAVLWESDPAAPQLSAIDGVFVAEVADLQQKTGLLAARFYGQPSQQMSLVGITGTDGKTSSAWMLAQAWQRLAIKAGMIGTLGKGAIGSLTRGAFTTPFALELQQTLAQFAAADCQQVVMEVSSHALHQSRVAGTAFDIAVLTNLSRDHLDYHGSLGNYAASKRRLFSDYQASIWVLNADDEFGQALLKAANDEAVEAISYGLGPANLQALELSQKNGLAFELHYQGRAYAIKTGLLGEFNVYNLLAVAAVLLAQDHKVEKVVQVLAELTAPPGRLELFTKNQRQVVVDYAHTPAALAAALKAVRAASQGRVACLFGCGGDRDRGKRALMAAAAEAGADLVWVSDDNPRSENPEQIFADIHQGFKGNHVVQFIHDRAEAIEAAIADLEVGDSLLVAGKGHEDYQLVNGQRRHFSDREQVAAVLGLPVPEVLYAA